MTLEHLNDEQKARVEALNAARDVGKTIPSAFGGTKPPDVTDLVDLAEYIVAGTHPMDSHFVRTSFYRERASAEQSEVQPDGCGGPVD